MFLDCFHHLCNNVLQLPPSTVSDKQVQYERGMVLYIVTDMCEHKAEQLLGLLGATKMLTLSSQLLQCHCDVIENGHVSFLDNHSKDLDNMIFGGSITMSIALGIVTMVMTCYQKVSIILILVY